MTKGTPSKGKQSGKRTHMRCRRCGRYAYHKRHSVCAACGFGNSSKLKKHKVVPRKLNRKRTN